MVGGIDGAAVVGSRVPGPSVSTLDGSADGGWVLGVPVGVSVLGDLVDCVGFGVCSDVGSDVGFLVGSLVGVAVGEGGCSPAFRQRFSSSK